MLQSISLKSPTSSQFFKNRVGVGVWSEEKYQKESVLDSEEQEIV